MLQCEKECYQQQMKNKSDQKMHLQQIKTNIMKFPDFKTTNFNI